MARSLLVIGIILHTIAIVCASNHDLGEIYKALDNGGEMNSDDGEQYLSLGMTPTNEMSAHEHFFAVPSRLARYLLQFRQALAPSSTFSDLKRSSSALDSLTGVTLAGKRSVKPYGPSSRFDSLLASYKSPLMGRRLKTKPKLFYDTKRFWADGLNVPPFV